MKKYFLHNMYAGAVLMFLFIFNFTASIAQTTISTSFTNTNGFAQVTFNFQNTNSYPVAITDIATVVGGGSQNVQAWYTPSAINGQPAGISNAYGWTMFGSGTVTNGTSTSVTPILTGLSLIIPAGATYGISVASTNVYYYDLPGGMFTFSGGGCNLLTGDNIGFGGDYPPNAPTFTPRGFVGSVTFANVCSGTPQQVVMSTAPIVNPMCQGATTLIVATDPNQPIAGISYQWQQGSSSSGPWTNVTNGTGATTLSYTTGPLPASNIWYVVNATCSNGGGSSLSFPFEVPIAAPVTPTISIASNPGDTICSGTPVTFTASITNGGTGPLYQWRKNNANVGTGSTIYTDNALVNGDKIACILTSNLSCVTQVLDTSNIDTMTVHAPPVPVVSGTGTALSTGTFTTYQWYLNGSQIVGATNNTYTATQNGDYTVHVADANGCSGTSAIHTVSGLGVANVVSNDNVNIYPNPAHNVLYIQATAIQNIEITDLVGQAVYNNKYDQVNNVTLDMQGLEAGIYFIKINHQYTTKLVKE